MTAGLPKQHLWTNTPVFLELEKNMYHVMRDDAPYHLHQLLKILEDAKMTVPGSLC